MSTASLLRHRNHHLSEEVKLIVENKHQLRRESLLEVLLQLVVIAEQALYDALGRDEPRDVLNAVSVATKTVATLLQFLPERDSPHSEIIIDLFDAEPPEWEDPVRLGGNGDR